MTDQAETERRGGDAPSPYRAALEQYAPSVLRGIRDHIELKSAARTPDKLAVAIEERLRDSEARAEVAAEFPTDMRLALALLPYMPARGWRTDEMRELLRYAGCAVPEKSLRALLASGLAALGGPAGWVETPRHFDLALNGWTGEELRLLPHPAARHQFTAPLFDPPKKGAARQVRNERESDGLEFLLRVAVIWQRIAESPIRVTQSTSVFKRDQERLYADSVLVAPMFGELAPLAESGAIALVLAKRLGLLEVDADSESLRAQLGSFWQEITATAQRQVWQALMAERHWGDPDAAASGYSNGHDMPAKRWLALLLLAAPKPNVWMSLAELDRELKLRGPAQSADPPRGSRPFQVVVGGAVTSPAVAAPRGELADWIESFVLGAMYQLGVVRVAEDSSGETVVQLSALGRWVLGLGPQPPQPPPFDKTLFVQPNHEVIVYRQGLTPELIGQLASFCRWKGLGAAVTLELTPESVYRGLELGRTAEEMVAILDRHSQRPLPPAVIDSMRNWSGRRERLRLYNRATVLEFASAEILEQALASGLAGDRLTDRMLLVPDERVIPFDRFRLQDKCDYGHAPKTCVEAADDGITWTVDLGRSDLLVACELSRFAEPMSAVDGERLRYQITPASLAAASRVGLGATYLREWFSRRGGADLPASVELMLQASNREGVELVPMVVLHTATAAAADGIVQHPATRQHVVRRLGPQSIAVRNDGVDALRAALQEMGIHVSAETDG
jgi:hypothetical protein